MKRKAKSANKKLAAWLMFLPVVIFSIGFQVIPIVSLIRSSLSGKGGLTLVNYQRAFTPFILDAFKNSLQLSLTTATLGVIFGTLVALAILGVEVILV